jgi:hypothetical protein
MKDRVELLLFYNDRLCKHSFAPLSLSAVVSSRTLSIKAVWLLPLLTSFRGQPPSPCGSTGSAWIYKSRVAGILLTSPLLTFAIEIPVEHFFKTLAFLNCGKSFPVFCCFKSTSGYLNWPGGPIRTLKSGRAKTFPIRTPGSPASDRP